MRRIIRRPNGSEKISDMHLFDKGWNALRDQIFANQKRLGVIPQDATLTPWPNDLLKEWDELTTVEKKLFIRQAEVYAAYLAYTDHEIGRVIQAVEDIGKLDNTLIIYISGDNGASAEGSPTGTPNETLPFNGINADGRTADAVVRRLGNRPDLPPHSPCRGPGRFDTPYKWTKQIPSFFGGTRQGMAISWPARIKDKGGIRWQFHHVIDIVPTCSRDWHPGAEHGGRHRAEADRRREHGLHLRQGQRDAPSPHTPSISR